MNIKINHISKIEGHAGFMASVLHGDVKKAKFEVQEGIRLIEGILIGRHYKDMPIIAQRICGICPVVHNLTAIKAIENAMQIKVSEETEKLRTVMEHAQFIHSHALHLFFLSLADFLDIENKKHFDELFFEIGEKLKIPILSGFKFGHAREKLTLPNGTFTKFSTEDKVLRIQNYLT